MKIILFLTLVLSCSELFSQKNTFQYSDSTFVVGTVHRVEYTWCYVPYPSPPNTIPCGNEPLIDSIVNFLNTFPSLKIEISDHTDCRGKAIYNRDLSKRKADEIVTFLIEKGIDPNRLVAVGYGADQPIIECEEIKRQKTKEEQEKSHQINRRVEIKILSL
jgi:hypothetical protein